MLRIACCLCWSLVACSLWTQEAAADPLIKRGGKPGVIASFKQDGKVVRLNVANGYALEAVLAAIQKGIPSVTVKPVGTSEMTVEGTPLRLLLKQLQKIEVDPAGDDVNEMFAALHNAASEGEEGSGSSIRATSQADFSEVVPPSEAAFTAIVKEAKRGEFPNAAVLVRILSVPKGATSSIKRGAEIRVIPRMTATKDQCVPTDELSRTNLGAWYVRAGDKISLRIEGMKKEGFWIASQFERAP